MSAFTVTMIMNTMSVCVFSSPMHKICDAVSELLGVYEVRREATAAASQKVCWGRVPPMPW
jgi:hypothetical protein